MCGIAGWLDQERDLRQSGGTMAGMIATLARRGPDDSGIWLSRQAALGHRRLIVVDPAGGGQPMVRKRGDRVCVLTYNGELYNTPELRAELAARGHVFQSHSDTETLLLAYLEWGPDCLEKLNGIFAFGIWDEGERTLLLARDRLGVKPLFYTRRGSAFLFASELKALLAHPDVPAELDGEGLQEIFLLGPAHTPGHGVFRGINELRPGQYLLSAGGREEVHYYWRLNSQPHPDGLAATAEKVRSLLEDTVSRQLVADVPVCTLLSGGLDSSAITAFAAAEHRRLGLGPVHTYSIDYEGNAEHFRAGIYQPDSDVPWIELVSGELGTEHHQIKIGQEELAEALLAAMRARDLPGMADIDASLLLFCREIKKGATVGLSGESADEVFGGYPWFYREEALQAGIFPWSLMTRARTGLLAPDLAALCRRERYVSRRYRETLAEVPRLEGEDVEAARRRELFYLNISWFLATLLDRKDRMSMASGLEVRVPFCDHRLVEYAWNMSWHVKACDGREKGILRRALRGVLPEGVLVRKKSPYPKTHHPAYTAIVSARLEGILNDPSSPLLPLVDAAVLRELIKTGAASFAPSWYGQLMSGPQLFAYFIQVEAWLREYKVSIV